MKSKQKNVFQYFHSTKGLYLAYYSCFDSLSYQQVTSDAYFSFNLGTRNVSKVLCKPKCTVKGTSNVTKPSSSRISEMMT